MLANVGRMALQCVFAEPARALRDAVSGRLLGAPGRMVGRVKRV